ncbi:MAG: response regulator [Chloroflexi bacterium]|nr:response regulator [Chloroflexota bacterium]
MRWLLPTTSGAEAVDIIRTQEPDVVLLDILIPDVTGMDVLDRVRSFSMVPTIAFTAKADIAQFALKNGADDYIAKPFDPDQLIQKY